MVGKFDVPVDRVRRRILLKWDVVYWCTEQSL